MNFYNLFINIKINIGGYIYMDSKIKFEKLRELREYRHLKQTDVAVALNIQHTTYSNYKTGKREMTHETIYKLAGIFDIPLEDLMHLLIDVDRDIDFDAPKETEDSKDLAVLLEYTSNPYNKEKLRMLSAYEKKLMYYFEQLSKQDKEEIIEFTKINKKQEKALLIRFFLLFECIKYHL